MANNLNKTNVGGIKTSSRSLNNLLASADKQFAEAINLLSGDRVVFGDAVTAISTGIQTGRCTRFSARACSCAQRRCPRLDLLDLPHLQLPLGSVSGGVRVLATWGGPLLSRTGGRLFSAMEQVGGRELFVV